MLAGIGCAAVMIAVAVLTWYGWRWWNSEPLKKYRCPCCEMVHDESGTESDGVPSVDKLCPLCEDRTPATEPELKEYWCPVCHQVFDESHTASFRMEIPDETQYQSPYPKQLCPLCEDRTPATAPEPVD